MSCFYRIKPSSKFHWKLVHLLPAPPNALYEMSSLEIGHVFRSILRTTKAPSFPPIVVTCPWIIISNILSQCTATHCPELTSFGILQQQQQPERSDSQQKSKSVAKKILVLPIDRHLQSRLDGDTSPLWWVSSMYYTSCTLLPRVILGYLSHFVRRRRWLW